MSFYYKIILLSLLVIAFSCRKEDADDGVLNLTGNSRKVYISNEGAFGFGNGSLSVFYPDSQIIINQAFEKKNNRKIGDVVQSVYTHNNLLFLLVNASNKIEIANTSTLEELKTLSNVSLPRYMVTDEFGVGWISCWGEGGVVKRLDLNSLMLSGQVNVGSGPENLLVHRNMLYVCNSGGFSTDSTISLINTASGSFEKAIIAGHNPVDIVKQDSLHIWVLCRGKVVYGGGGQIVDESNAKLARIETINNTIDFSIDLANGFHPSNLAISPDAGTIYYGGGYGSNGIFTFNTQSLQLSTSPLISGEYYAFDVDPITGDIYCFESQTFTQSGRLKIFNQNYELIESYQTGIGPNGARF